MFFQKDLMTRSFSCNKFRGGTTTLAASLHGIWGEVGLCGADAQAERNGEALCLESKGPAIDPWVLVTCTRTDDAMLGAERSFDHKQVCHQLVITLFHSNFFASFFFLVLRRCIAPGAVALGGMGTVRLSL